MSLKIELTVPLKSLKSLDEILRFFRTHSTQQPRVDTQPHVDDDDDDDDEDVDDPLPGDLLVKSEPSPQSSNSGIQFLTLSRFICFF